MVIALDETGGSDRSDRKYRTEGWRWLLAGGAVYDHLDFSCTTGIPGGTAVPLSEGTPLSPDYAEHIALRIIAVP